MTSVSFLSYSDDVTLPSSAKLQLVTGWTPHMSGKGGETLQGKDRGKTRVNGKWSGKWTTVDLSEKKDFSAGRKREREEEMDCG